MDTSSKRLWLVDSSIYVFRSWYTWPKNLRDSENNSINAVHGFLHFAYQLLIQEQPSEIAFVFDESLKHSHRRELYPEYKSNRKSAPVNLRHQFKLCRSFLKAAGIVECSSAYYEADDIIGTLADYHRNKGYKINIITGDKDLTQLVHDNDVWWEYGNNKKMNAGDIKKSFGVSPNQIADLLAISGDKSDNIPGVPDIGMSTAAKLLKRFNSLDNLIKSSAEIGSTKLRRAKHLQNQVVSHIDQLRLSRKLTEVVCDAKDAPTHLSLKRGSLKPDTKALWKLFDVLQCNDIDRQKWIKLVCE